MCLQCETDAKIIGELYPFYTLMQARIGHEKWPAGAYAIVTSNDPHIVFPVAPVKDPFYDLTDDEFDALSVDEYRAREPYAEAVKALRVVVPNDMKRNYDLVAAMVKAGYDPNSDGDPTWLLVQRAAEVIENAK